MSQWKNSFGVSIRKGCFSCKFSEDADANATMKMCVVDDDNDNNKHGRDFHCAVWEAKECLKWIGSGRTPTGAVAHAGDVKSLEYFRWLLKNANEPWMPGSPMDKREAFKRQFPDKRLYYIKA